jgi:hypothetical protein
VPWYQSKGFHVYSQLNSGFTLFFLKRDWSVYTAV